MLPITFFATDIRCQGNEIWDKIGFNSAWVRDYCKIFATIGRFSVMGYRMLPIAFSPTDPRWNGNEIWDKIGYNSRRVRDFSKIFAFIKGGGFGDRPLNAANDIFITNPRCHGNEISGKFHCNSASVRNFFEIFLPKIIGGKGFWRWAIVRCQLLFFWLIPVAMPTKFETKLAITR